MKRWTDPVRTVRCDLPAEHVSEVAPIHLARVLDGFTWNTYGWPT